MAHAHGQNIHPGIFIPAGSGLCQQFPHLGKKAAGGGVIGIGGRNGHQPAHFDVGLGGGSIQQRPQVVLANAALAFLGADVDLHQDLLGDAQPLGGGLDLIQQPRAVHALDQRSAAHHLVDLVGLQVADEMPRLAVVSSGVGLFHKFLHVVFTKQVNGQIGAVAHFFHCAGLAGGAQQHLAGIAACGLGGGGHVLADPGNGLGHCLLLCFVHQRTSVSLYTARLPPINGGRVRAHSKIASPM